MLLSIFVSHGKVDAQAGGALEFSLLALCFPRNFMCLNEEKSLSGKKAMWKLFITIGNGHKGPAKSRLQKDGGKE